MMETVVGLIRFVSSLLFGVAVSYLFAGIGRTRKKRIVAGCAFFVLLIMLSVCLWLLGLDMTAKLYPLIVHVPLILAYSLYDRCPWLTSVASVLSAYLCLQVPRWIGFLAEAALGSRLAEHVFYVASVYLVYAFLKMHVAGSISELLERSPKSRVLLGVIPLCFYLFDYLTIVSPEMLDKNAKWVTQFMPSILSVVYFVFVILYHEETEKQAKAQKERDLLNVELQLARKEFATLRQLQECAAVYRHDMRHHFSYLQSLATQGSLDGIKDYLRTTQSDIEAITPVRFCENEAANLILSAFSSRAAQESVHLSVDAVLPVMLPLSDTELCALLSNSLENALAGAAACIGPRRKMVSFKARVHKNKLLISTGNPYSGEITWKDGRPRSPVEGHGYGTRSIVSIAENHDGQVLFEAEGGVFNMKVMLPLGS